jgi:hypothetical protein
MGIVMEIIILQNGELPGFILSILAGGLSYSISSLALGTFEKEDYKLLESVKRVCPEPVQKLIDALWSLLIQFKPEK